MRRDFRWCWTGAAAWGRVEPLGWLQGEGRGTGDGGSWGAISLFSTLAVDRYLLEYDTERAGTIEPLRFMPRDKMVVLGLVSSKESTFWDMA